MHDNHYDHNSPLVHSRYLLHDAEPSYNGYKDDVINTNWRLIGVEMTGRPTARAPRMDGDRQFFLLYSKSIAH